LETEKQLVDGLKNQDLGKAHHWLILHGRYICTARSPHCQQCGIAEYCAYFCEQKKIVATK
ncbi:MAG: endonuclease III, partial [Mucinivorans sp.]